jgi:hypothetical protein
MMSSFVARIAMPASRTTFFERSCLLIAELRRPAMLMKTNRGPIDIVLFGHTFDVQWFDQEDSTYPF